MSHDISAVMEKIEKIRQLSERGGTVHEAEAAATKMQELLLRYNLTLEDLSKHAERTNRKVSEAKVTMKQADWRWRLLDCVAKAHLGHTVMSRRSGTPVVHVFAHPHNLIVIKSTYEWLVDEVCRLSSQYHTDAVLEGDERARKSSRGWQGSFKLGAVDGLSLAYAKMREKVKRETASSGWALVPVLEAEVKDAVSRAFPVLHSSRDSRPGSMGAYHVGRKVGSEINLDRQVGRSGARGQIGG